MLLIDAIIKIISIFDNFFKKNFQVSLLRHISTYYQKNCEKYIYYKKKKLKFFCPTKETEIRVKSFFSKEPDTIKWIKNFKNKKIIFWDIGSNIGIFSIYAAIIHKNIKIVSFEGALSNLRILSRNLYINSLNHKIGICQIPVTNNFKGFQYFHENQFLEGTALNYFVKKNVKKRMYSYKILGTSLDSIYTNQKLRIPNYIKIDVDGLEYLVLDGGKKILQSRKLKEILVEINERNIKIKNTIMRKLIKYNFKFIDKFKCNINDKKSFEYNYLFKKI